MSYQIYKIIHLSAIVAFFIIMGMAAADSRKTKFRTIGSGIALFFALLGGFGLMARLGIPHNNWPLWIYLKFAVWILVGSFGHALMKRAPHLLRKYLAASFVLFIAAAYFANYKIG